MCGCEYVIIWLGVGGCGWVWVGVDGCIYHNMAGCWWVWVGVDWY